MIIICDYCQKYVCPAPCPNFDGYEAGLGGPQSRCFNCESKIYGGETSYTYEDKTICQECAEELIPKELLELLDCKNFKVFFDLLP